jgi:uncharacterized protein YkwD
VASNQLLKEVPISTHKDDFNRFLGIIPGLINGLINALVLAALLLALPFGGKISETTRNSALVEKLTVPAEWVEEKFSPVFDDALRKTMNKLTVEPESDKTVTLPFKVSHARVRDDLEAKMLDLLNQERTSRGLQPLKADTAMRVVARKHSQDMFARGYFSHIDPDGKDPFDRMRNEGVRFVSAGENLALAQTLNIAHTGLMNSPGHRANILQPSFGRVGIGILDGGVYGLMITQNFRN